MECPVQAELPDTQAVGAVNSTLLPIAAVPSLGPDAEEFADFDRASQPRPWRLTSADFSHLLTGLLMLLLVVFGSIVAGLIYDANRPQNLIVGSWQAIDHPDFAGLDFYQNGSVRCVFKSKAATMTGYRFISRNTVAIANYDNLLHTGIAGQFYVRFDDHGMTTEDKHKRVIYHWRRVR